MSERRAIGKLDIRLDSDLKARIEAFAKESSIESLSTAARMLLTMGLAQGKNIDEKWRRQAFREGALAGKATLLKLINEAFTETLNAEQV